MKRRALLTFAAGGFVLRALPALAQSTGKIAVIGRLHPGSLSDPAQIKFMQAFRDAMRALGYVEGQAYRMEARYADGDVARLPALAADLVQLKVDAIMTGGATAALVAKQATSTIPIVMAMSGPDPVAHRLIDSLTRPGGNVTGLTGLLNELPVKQLEMLREAVPDLSDVVILYSSHATNRPDHLLHSAAAQFGITLHVGAIATLQDVDAAFANLAGARQPGAIVFADPIFTDRLRGPIAARALHHRVPMVGSFRITAEAGALLAYAEDLNDMHRRSATYIDKILRGAKPAELPVEQPTKFELVLNLRTARALGIEVPAAIIARADEVIE